MLYDLVTAKKTVVDKVEWANKYQQRLIHGIGGRWDSAESTPQDTAYKPQLHCSTVGQEGPY